MAKSLTKLQTKAIETIKKMEEHFGVRWFVQTEVGVTLHTMDALVRKGCIEEQEFNDIPYYRLKGVA